VPAAFAVALGALLAGVWPLPFPVEFFSFPEVLTFSLRTGLKTVYKTISSMGFGMLDDAQSLEAPRSQTRRRQNLLRQV
jgi:hypothetical protein